MLVRHRHSKEKNEKEYQIKINQEDGVCAL